jgi:hypothetical protein
MRPARLRVEIVDEEPGRPQMFEGPGHRLWIEPLLDPREGAVLIRVLPIEAPVGLYRTLPRLCRYGETVSSATAEAAAKAKGAVSLIA